jgi:hypothetical protein
MKHKQIVLWLLVGLVMVFSQSCGSKEKAEQPGQVEENGEAKKSGAFSAEGGLLTADVPDQYSVDGARILAEGDIRLYSSIDNDRDFYKIMEYGHAEILDPNKETEVDGLPALTNKHKYRTNIDMIARTWLIWNGIDQIQITVQAPAENWSDEVAEDLITYIKINRREGSPELPAPKEKAAHIVPEVFPEEGIMLFEDALSQEAVLDLDKINRAMSFFEAMVNLEETDMEDPEAGSEAVLDELAVEHGLAGFSEFEQITMSSNGAFSLMHSFGKIQELEEGTEAYKFTSEIIKSVIQQAKLSYQDIRFVFDQWDHVKAYVKQLEAHKNSQ